MTFEYNRNTISTYTEKEPNNIRSQTYLEALESYTRAIQLDPTNASTYVKRGEIYTLLEQYDEALADYSRAIQLDPSLKLFKPEIQFHSSSTKESNTSPKFEFQRGGIASNLLGVDLLVDEIVETTFVGRSELMGTVVPALTMETILHNQVLDPISKLFLATVRRSLDKGQKHLNFIEYSQAANLNNMNHGFLTRKYPNMARLFTDTRTYRVISIQKSFIALLRKSGAGEISEPLLSLELSSMLHVSFSGKLRFILHHEKQWWDRIILNNNLSTKTFVVFPKEWILETALTIFHSGEINVDHVWQARQTTVLRHNFDLYL